MGGTQGKTDLHLLWRYSAIWPKGVTTAGDEQQFEQQRRWTTSDAVTPDGRMVAASTQNSDGFGPFLARLPLRPVATYGPRTSVTASR
jgi:hypothetical protein